MSDTASAVEADIAWTERQRQVLDLLARGKTNPEIAEILGVSLAGAKWHVSEVISKLGVTSREEAAAWWQQRRRPLTRVLRSFAVPLSVGLVRGAAAAAVLLVAAGTVVTIAIASRGSDSPGDGVKAQQATPTLDTAQPADAVFTLDKARVRAYELAQIEIDANSFWDAVLVGGRKIQASDMLIADEQFVKGASTVRSRARATEWRGGQGENVWAFTLELSGLSVSGTDGQVDAFVIFEDGTGERRTVGLGGPSPLDPPMRLDFDYETATRLASVTVMDKEWVIKAQETGDGSQCLLYNDPRVSPLGVSGAGCGKPYLGNWPFTVTASVLPGGQVFWGAAGNGVEGIRLNFADGTTQMVELRPLPPELPFGWRWFALGIQGDIDVLSADGLAADGSIIYTQALGPWGDRALAAPPPQEGQNQLEASGAGAGATEEIAIKPPPAFQRLSVRFNYQGTDPVSVDLVCDEVRQTIFNHLRPDGSFEIAGLIDIPPGASSCHYEVSGSGAWTLRSF